MLGFEFQFEQNGLTEEKTEKFGRGKKEALGSLRSEKSVQRLALDQTSSIWRP
jgi:hypothetical protein